MYSKRLREVRHSVAFRLTIWYAGVFTASFLGIFLMFYMLVLHAGSGISHHALSALREDFREYIVTPLIVVVALSAGVGWFMAKRALSGVEAVTRAAEDISKGALDRRVSLKGHSDEIDRLAETFNAMVDRIQALISQMKEITENIAHDLRSPITRMRGMAEMALSTAGPEEEWIEAAGTIIEECDRLLGMINAALDISEAETGLAKVQAEEVDLVVLVRDVCELFEPAAEDRGVALEIEAPPSLPVSCDLRKIQRVLSNLLDNAIKYTVRGGHVEVHVEARPEGAMLSVQDTGIGISDADLPHVFERFYRGEKSRSEVGNGLGLSLAQAFVLIHGGTITAWSEQGKGTKVVVTLPKLAPSAGGRNRAITVTTDNDGADG
jgi:signal transduction histidine kinase